jgi:hypothetical protein
MSVCIVIPARLRSTRLSEKALADIHGKPMVQHVYERAKLVRGVDDVIVATDHEKVQNAVAKFGGKSIMTPETLSSGTDRVAFVAQKNTARKARDQWEQENAPTAELWDAALRSKGYQPSSDEKLLHSAVRALPTGHLIESGAWVSPDHRAYLILGPPSMIYFYGEVPRKNGFKPEWTPLGSGWRGFSAVWKELAHRPQQVLRPRAQTAADPLEIRY